MDPRTGKIRSFDTLEEAEAGERDGFTVKLSRAEARKLARVPPEKRGAALCVMRNLGPWTNVNRNRAKAARRARRKQRRAQ